MLTRCRSALLAGPVVAAVLTAGCGGSTQEAGTQETGPSAQGSPATSDCARIAVPGHVAVNVQTGGEDCDTATALVEAAVGQGRQAYEAESFSCDPADASGGDTDYTCTRDDTRITFRYGAG